MSELPLIFLSGLLGAGHCVGMCGAFAVAIGWNTRGPRENLIRQCCYSAGRTSTYTFLGAVAGFAGQQLQFKLGFLSSVQSILSIVAGVLLIGAGLAATGFFPARRWLSRITSCPAAAQMKALLTSPSRWSVFVAGLATGFLPCGLIYAMLILAAGSMSVGSGAVIMAVFGLGTIPMMLSTGLGSSLLSVAARSRLLRLAACSMILMGGLTVARGASQWRSNGDGDKPVCPFCEPRST